MLYLIGLGLADEKDISVRGLEIVKRASRVYLEAYTAILLVEKHVLESFYGREVILADREMVESNSEAILKSAEKEDVAFLVVGDPCSATTHTDLLLRARHATPAIPTRVLPNTSIMTAIGCTGLQLYNFGQTVSMVFFTDNWKPTSIYDRIKENVAHGFHTLVLLDIKVKEASEENMARGRPWIFEPPRFMSSALCAEQLLYVEGERKEGICGPDNLAVAVARVGSEEEKIVAGTLEELSTVDLGKPLHSLVLIGKKGHEMEMEYVRDFAIDKAKFEVIWKRDYGKS
ncbi:putative diphthine synthase [Pseudovirgaria hyperparasitica]|uniref:Diphthine methyl ester synthase n=1 Tax=Pseudovirgaria hyperparasitica TaxID=470096 RepID=A0A6A6VUR0_9PEZI|nr:putative diphthine synthase [Pseudovirgaria hyperparasitica]KAF2753619.1 putative diphthine synthase [Pseudovirgaria hyperparasitica]